MSLLFLVSIQFLLGSLQYQQNPALQKTDFCAETHLVDSQFFLHSKLINHTLELKLKSLLLGRRLISLYPDHLIWLQKKNLYIYTCFHPQSLSDWVLPGFLHLYVTCTWNRGFISVPQKIAVWMAEKPCL